MIVVRRPPRSWPNQPRMIAVLHHVAPQVVLRCTFSDSMIDGERGPTPPGEEVRVDEAAEAPEIDGLPAG